MLPLDQDTTAGFPRAARQECCCAPWLPSDDDWLRSGVSCDRGERSDSLSTITAVPGNRKKQEAAGSEGPGLTLRQAGGADERLRRQKGRVQALKSSSSTGGHGQSVARSPQRARRADPHSAMSSCTSASFSPPARSVGGREATRRGGSIHSSPRQGPRPQRGEAASLRRRASAPSAAQAQAAQGAGRGLSDFEDFVLLSQTALCDTFEKADGVRPPARAAPRPPRHALLRVGRGPDLSLSAAQTAALASLGQRKHH